MASFNDLWNRLQGAERDIYQDLEERYLNYIGNASATACADTAIGAARPLTLDDRLQSLDYTSAYRYPSASETAVSFNIDNSTDFNGNIIYHSTVGWDANWPGLKENELDDVSEEELMSVIGLEGGDV